MDYRLPDLGGKRPNEVPLKNAEGLINVHLAAIRIQCFWRRVQAKRTVKNGCLRHWFLEKNAFRIQIKWRSYSAKRQLENLKKLAAAALVLKEQKYEEAALLKFKESLLWRMTLCCEKAVIIQKWWSKRIALLKARQDSTGIEQMRVACFDPKAIQTVIRRSKEDEARLRQEEQIEIRPTQSMLIPASIPLGSDKTPMGGILRTAVRPPPSSGILNINLRKEERERKELKLLEADILMTNTRFGDQRFSLFKEKKRIETDSAIKIQSMFRRNVAKEKMGAKIIARQDRYYRLCPTKFAPMQQPVEAPS